MKSFLLYLAIPACGIISSCSAELTPAKADVTYYNIRDEAPVDSSVVKFIQPYHDSLSAEMNQVIAVSSMKMEKGKPESLLGNFVADLLLEKGRQYDSAANFCVVNYGGLRVPSLPAGEITKGMIYELMPFDNFLVIMELSEATVAEMIDPIASQGGWPVAGIKFKIQQQKAFEILINNLPLQPDKIYHAVMSDYLADGGDNLAMLKGKKRKISGIFIRDLILEYLAEQTENGKTISSSLDKRIIAE